MQCQYIKDGKQCTKLLSGAEISFCEWKNKRDLFEGKSFCYPHQKRYLDEYAEAQEAMAQAEAQAEQDALEAQAQAEAEAQGEWEAQQAAMAEAEAEAMAQQGPDY